MTRMLENVALEKLKRIGKTIAFVFLSRRDTYVEETMNQNFFH